MANVIHCLSLLFVLSVASIIPAMTDRPISLGLQPNGRSEMEEGNRQPHLGDILTNSNSKSSSVGAPHRAKRGWGKRGDDSVHLEEDNTDSSAGERLLLEQIGLMAQEEVKSNTERDTLSSLSESGERNLWETKRQSPSPHLRVNLLAALQRCLTTDCNSSNSIEMKKRRPGWGRR